MNIIIFIVIAAAIGFVFNFFNKTNRGEKMGETIFLGIGGAIFSGLYMFRFIGENLTALDISNLVVAEVGSLGLLFMTKVLGKT